MTRTLLLAALLGAPLAAQNAYLVDTNLDQLFALDLNTGGTTLIGSTLNNGLDTAADLCWRDDTDTIWTIDLSGGEVGTIDPQTGTFTPIWQTGLSGWQGMAWDHTTKRFLLHNQNDQLHALDPATGLTTLIGTLATATPLVTAIEVDASGRLWGMDFSAGAIMEIDKNTGIEIGRVPTPGLTNVQGMGISAEGVWYAVSTGTDSLYVVDPATGTSVLIGANPGTQFAKGMVVTGSSIQRVGTACADGNNDVRRMTWTGGSNLGNFVLHGCDAGTTTMPSFIAYGLSGTQAGPFVLPLSMASFGAPGCTLYQSAQAISPPTSTGTPLAFVVPAAPGFEGITIFAQCVILDVSANPNAAGLVFTDAIKMTTTL